MSNLLIKSKDIILEYNGTDILDIEKIEILNYDRIGLIGMNGSGKTSLLKILSGKIVLPNCTINRYGKLSYIPQLGHVGVGEISDNTLKGKLKITHLQSQTISGGEETRIKIAKVFSDQAHGILLDEPTNHLDRSGINFLISKLKMFDGALLVVSHNRYFLDNVVDKIWELKDGKITDYWGGYSDYFEYKKEEKRKHLTQYEQYKSEIKKLNSAIGNIKDNTQKIASQNKKKHKKRMTESAGRLGNQKMMSTKEKKLQNAAKSIEHRIEALAKVEKPEEIKKVHFRYSQSLSLHKSYPISAKEFSIHYDDRILLENTSFQIPLGAKVALTGDNGTGKTTLFNKIANREDGLVISQKAQIGYFTQEGYKINRNILVIEYLQEDCDYKVHEIRAVIASLGLSQDNIRKNLNVLSGGEIAKILLTKLLLGRYNILLMDEPNNFLDIQSLEALKIFMKDYKGIIFFITHDHYLIEDIADIVYEIKDKKMILKNL